jgi:hypothetical protein
MNRPIETIASVHPRRLEEDVAEGEVVGDNGVS